MNVRNSDRSFRSLAGLERTASTSRVLNLAAVGTLHSADPEYAELPFFQAVGLNGAVVIKHRLRADEQYLFEHGKRIATKLVIPFERTDLGLGGRSVLVGQRGWLTVLAELSGSDRDLSRDIRLLEALDELPSLDPFLLREHLRRRDFNVANCYFAISPADLERMQRFVSAEISRLVMLAYGGLGGQGNITKLVDLLLSGVDDMRLEPLRITLGLEGDNFREGLFSWKGFLYYKWVLNSLWPDLRQVIAELRQIKIVGTRDLDTLSLVNDVGERVNKAIFTQINKVRATLQVYDDSFAQLTQEGNPVAFRDFLLKSPEMFLSLGERTGMISHIASFWRYRFPKDRPLRVEMDELLDILQDFHHGLNGANEAGIRPAAYPSAATRAG